LDKLGKKKFFSNFSIFIRGYIIKICKKWQKIKIFKFEHLLIGNLIRSKMRYAVQFFDHYFHILAKN